MKELITEYVELKEKIRSAFRPMEGEAIKYNKSGYVILGELLFVHDYSPQLKVRSHTGKEYYIFWDNFIGLAKTDCKST